MELIKLKPALRASTLERRRRLKMARSAHAYVRGNTLKFYEWLEGQTNGRLPDGPSVWICGDCHVGNLGPVANAKGRVEIEIRDLDQTVIGNPAHDLIRLGLSLAMAARGSDLPGVTTARMLEQLMQGYESALGSEPVPDDVPDPVKKVLKQALHRKWRHLAEERLEDVKPSIPLGKSFWPLKRDEKREIAGIFQDPALHKLVTSLHGRASEDEVRVLDSAYWMKGCSSLGHLRYAVLLEVGEGSYRDGGLCLMDIKEAVKAAAPRTARATMPRDNGKRVVEGARNLSPFLGARMMPGRFFERSVVIRELMPQDLKLDLDRLTCDEAVSIARFLAAVVGKAHARQMDEAGRAHWKTEMSRNRSKTLDAPSWLWSSVVELVASHEIAYLEHCRKYANQAA